MEIVVLNWQKYNKNILHKNSKDSVPQSSALNLFESAF